MLAAKVAEVNKSPKVNAYFPDAFEKVENPVFSATKRKQRVSSYKLTRVCNLVAGRHIYDAIALTKNLNSKSGEIVRSVLEAARKNGLNQGYSEDRFFVKTAITNRKLTGKKIDIKGRGKHGVIQGTSSTCRIWMEEKNPADYYKMILLGKTPTGIAWMMRRVLY